MDKVNIWKLTPGAKIRIKTLHHDYYLETIDQERVKIQGGDYFVESQIVILRGATRGGVIRVGKIELDHAIELILEDGKIVSTSRVEEIEINGS